MPAADGRKPLGLMVPRRRPRVVHVINSLQVGGAETMLARLATAADQPLEHLVLPLRAGGGIEERVRRAGALLPAVGVDGLALAGAPYRLARRLRQLKPDIIQGWLPQANLAVSVASVLGSLHVPVLWNVRWTLYDFREERLHNRLLLRASGLIAPRTDRIIYNAHIAVAQHEAIGYPPANAAVIPNGFDVHLYHPDPTARRRIRNELGIPEAAVVVGMIARYHPMKQHLLSLKAAARVVERHPSAIFVYVGTDVDEANSELATTVDHLRLRPNVRLLGERQNVASIYNAFDVYWMASWAKGRGEGFPNVIAEAMATGLPCVATDVGEARALIGSTGRIVSPGDVSALADAVIELLDTSVSVRRQLGSQARQRIVSEYALESVIQMYSTLYEDVLRSHH